MRARAPALAAASLAAALAALAGAAGAAPLRAQDAPSPPTPQALAPAPAASPLVPPDHWAWAAARRLDVLGLAPPGFPKSGDPIGHDECERKDGGEHDGRVYGRRSKVYGGCWTA